MTLIEVMVSVLVLTVAVQILTSIVTASISYSTMKRERGLAVEGAMNAIEEMHATPFFDVFTEFNSDRDDDPGGPGTGHGALFDVPGLDPVEGATTVGEIRMPERSGALYEGLNDVQLGTPRDLNGDLLIDKQDHSDDYLILPVSVTIRWRGRYGNQSLTLATMLADVEKEGD